jgi:hypothetical protein
MPDEFDGLAENFAEGIKSVVIAIRSGKDNDSKFHRVAAPWRDSIIAGVHARGKRRVLR